MAAEDIDKVIQRLQRIRAGILTEVCVPAVAAAQEPIVEAARGIVPVRTGLLQSTIVQHEPQVEGDSAVGLVSAGSEETVTNWRGVGNEIFQELGTATGTPATHYMERATLESQDSMLRRASEAARDGLRRLASS